MKITDVTLKTQYSIPQNATEVHGCAGMLISCTELSNHTGLWLHSIRSIFTTENNGALYGYGVTVSGQMIEGNISFDSPDVDGNRYVHFS